MMELPDNEKVKTLNHFDKVQKCNRHKERHHIDRQRRWPWQPIYHACEQCIIQQKSVNEYKSLKKTIMVIICHCSMHLNVSIPNWLQWFKWLCSTQTFKLWQNFLNIIASSAQQQWSRNIHILPTIVRRRSLRTEKPLLLYHTNSQ